GVECAAQVAAGHARQQERRDEEGGTELGDPVERLLPGGGARRRVAPRAYALGQPASGCLFVLDDEDPFSARARRLSHGSSVPSPGVSRMEHEGPAATPIDDGGERAGIQRDAGFGEDRLATSRRRKWESLGEVVLCSGYPTQLAIGGGLHLAGVPAITPEGGLSLPFLAWTSALDTILLLTLVVWLTRRRGDSVKQLFFGHRPAAREALLGVALAPAVLGLITVTMLVIRLVAPALRT